MIQSDPQVASPAAELARFVAREYGRVLDIELAERVLERWVPDGEELAACLAQAERSGPGSPERRRLVQLVTVGETYFFREAAQFRVLEQTLDELWAQQGRRLVVWCPGTSTGEDAYSLAITALRAFGAEAGAKVRILATDLNAAFIARAERGVFGRRSFRGTTPEQLQDFFTPEGEGFAISRAARELVSFAEHNLVAPEPYEDIVGARPDVILCRNVCLYFDRQTFREVNLRLAKVLADGGSLFLGAAETVLHDSGLVALVKREQTFSLDKAASGGTAAGMPAPPAVRQAEFRRATGLLGKRPFHGGTGPLRPLPFRADVDAELPLDQDILGEAAILLDMGEYLKAAALCHLALEDDPFRPAAHFLLGLSRRLMGSLQEAVHQFRAAAYLQPDDWLASFHLAETYRSLDDHDEALREYRATLARMDAAVDEPAPALLGGFAPEYFRRASQRQVDRLLEE